jgi:hypothetical protein
VIECNLLVDGKQQKILKWSSRVILLRSHDPDRGTNQPNSENHRLSS